MLEQSIKNRLDKKFATDSNYGILFNFTQMFNLICIPTKKKSNKYFISFCKHFNLKTKIIILVVQQKDVTTQCHNWIFTIRLNSKYIILLNSNVKMSREIQIFNIILFIINVLTYNALSGYSSIDIGSVQQDSPNQQSTVFGSGSSLIIHLADSFAVYQLIEGYISMVYTFTSSKVGKQQLLNNEIDYVLSESSLKIEDYDHASDLIQLPFAANAIVNVYNIPNLTECEVNAELIKQNPLTLSRSVLVKIFTNQIQYWNDSDIIQLNPQLSSYLPYERIKVIVLDNSAGTTEIFTNALLQFDESFANYLNASDLPNWTNVFQNDALIFANSNSCE